MRPLTYRRWTRDEVLYLWHHAGKRTLRQLARKLGRSQPSVQAKAKALGIRLRSADTLHSVAAYLGVGHATVLRHRNRLGQRWRLKHSPRGPELEDVRAIAKSILEAPGGGRSTVSLRRLQRIAQGAE